MSRSRRERACLSLLMTLAATAPSARAQQSPAPAEQAAAPVYLLDVQINGWPLGLVARFVLDGDRLRIPAEQYDGLGFAPAEQAAATIDGTRWIWLDRVPELLWKIDQSAQTIAFTAPPRLLKITQIRVAPGFDRISARADWGAMLAWDLFGQWSPRDRDPLFARSYSVDLDTRLFSPLFTLINRGVVTGGAHDDTRFVRRETYADFDDTGNSTRLRLGDSLTTGPIWLRTMRFGGVQWGRDFALRPDIVTMPVPVLDREVAVPSTVDLFVNGVERISSAVTPGPLRLSDLPVVTGANTIRTVVTDRSGRRTELVLPFYASGSLLARGMTDFSLAAGFPRRNYDVTSNDYAPPFASGVVRHGVSDGLTLSAFAAGARRYVTAAFGATTTIGGFAMIDAALFGGRADGRNGWAFFAGAARSTARFNLAASYTRSFGYADLTAHYGYVRLIEAVRASGGVNLGRIGQLNLVYSRQRNAGQSQTSLVSGTYAIDVGRRRAVRLAASGYADTDHGSWGAVLSLTLPLGRNASVYAQQGWTDGRPSSRLALQGTGFRDRLDWQLNAETAPGQGQTYDASASWDGRVADLFVRASRVRDSTEFQGEIAQSLVLMDGDLFLTGRIDDGFTVVDTQTPGVRVALENRPVGRTGKSGRLFVPDLQSYLPNTVALDPTDLPIDAALADPVRRVAPRGGAGMVTRFDVTRERSAVVVLARTDGTPPPAGATVSLAGTDFAAPLGFGGEIFVRGLSAGENKLEVEWRDGRCIARFTARTASGTLPRLGPYQCVP